MKITNVTYFILYYLRRLAWKEKYIFQIAIPKYALYQTAEGVMYFMIIGVSTGYRKLDKFSEIYKDLNIQHVQISIPADVTLIESDLLKTIDRLKSNNNIEISLHAYPFNLAERVEPVRRVWIELAEKTLVLAGKIGASFVNFHAGYGFDAAQRTEHKKLVKGLIPVLCEITEKGIINNVEIHIENLYPEQRNSDFCKIGDRPGDFQIIFDNIDSPSLKLCYDYGHGNLDEHGIDILRNFTSRLGSIHAHDNDQLADIHWPIGNKDKGTIDWDKEIQYLKDIDFKGVLILESYPAEQLESLKYLQGL